MRRLHPSSIESRSASCAQKLLNKENRKRSEENKKKNYEQGDKYIFFGLESDGRPFGVNLV